MKATTRRMGVRTKILLPIILVMTMLIAILGFVLASSVSRASIKLALEVTEIATQYAANQVDAELLKQIVPGSETSEAYATIHAALKEVVDTTAIMFAYTMYTDNYNVYNGVVVGVSSDVGSRVTVDYQHVAPVFSGTPVVDSTFRETEYGTIINCYTPIFDDVGRVVGAVGCSYDVSDVMDIVKRSQTTALIAVIFNILAIASVGTFVVTRVVAPLKNAQQLMHVIAACDLNAYIDTDAMLVPDDEIGDIISCAVNALCSTRHMVAGIKGKLDRMAAGDFRDTVDKADEFKGDYRQLHHAICLIRDRTREALEPIQRLAAELASSAGQITAGAQSVSQGASEQAAAVEELAATTDEIGQRAKDAAMHAEEVNGISASANGLIQQCSDQMDSLIAAMTDIGTRSEEVSKIIKVIEDIAFQTNILALNAAIEAACAGAAGRGFSVVADEVRSLAAKTAEASQSTSDLIEASSRAVDNGLSLGYATATQLAKVVKSTDEVISKMSLIVDDAAEQSRSIDQVSTGVSQIAGVVQTNSAASEQSAAASEQLMDLAAKLNELLGRFKL